MNVSSSRSRLHLISQTIEDEEDQVGHEKMGLNDFSLITVLRETAITGRLSTAKLKN
jgi:hypothetical protein